MHCQLLHAHSSHACAQEYVKQREVEFKQRERYNRYPRQLPPSEAVAAVLTDEQLDAFTAELLIKELGRTGAYLHARQGHGSHAAWALLKSCRACKGMRQGVRCSLAGSAWDASEAKSCCWLAAVAVGLLRTWLSQSPLNIAMVSVCLGLRFTRSFTRSLL